MQLHRYLAITAALAGVACDSEPNNEPANTTTSVGEESGGDPDTGAAEGCFPPPLEGTDCTSDEECALAGDCCSCFAYKPEWWDPGNCGGSCAMDKCEEWGITEAVCHQGYCAAVDLSCNQALVTCKVAPPTCDAGSLPQVWNGCYTGGCLPIEACDWAPDCSVCAEGQLCMHEQRNGCDYVRCVDDMAECLGEGPCCTGESWCAACTPTPDGFACGDQG
jgi:hypothetical protein